MFIVIPAEKERGKHVLLNTDQLVNAEFTAAYTQNESDDHPGEPDKAKIVIATNELTAEYGDETHVCASTTYFTYRGAQAEKIWHALTESIVLCGVKVLTIK